MATKYVSAMRNYFGFQPGKGIQEFGAELRALSAEEKEWFRVNLGKHLGEELEA